MKRRRAYTKVRRAAAEEETRLRIVDALVALHEEVGPSRTTVTAVAEKAGVERLTVYRHFSDEAAMVAACSARWSALHPPPEVAPFRGGDRVRWLRKAVRSLYGWYRTNARMLSQIESDVSRVPAVAEAWARHRMELDRLAEGIASAWPDRDRRRSSTIRHALDFSTWRSLSALVGDDREAAALVAAWVGAPAGSAR